MLSLSFTLAQSIATFAAMTSNFLLNNELTYRDRRLNGWSMLWGFLSFCAICSLGALTNVGFAAWLFRSEREVWWVAGLAGALMARSGTTRCRACSCGARDDIPPVTMAALEAATQRARVCGRKRAISLADARVWVAGSSPAMVSWGNRYFYAAIAGLILLRFIAAAVLPLSADEAYYWLWSKHLAAGYYDHPPMIAFLIRAGTMLFGDTAFGVRAMPVLLSVAASWFVWRSGGPLASLLFNLTLMITVETMVATPDAPLIAASAAFLWAMTKLDEDPRWWLAVGAAGGMALLSKYTGFFLGAGALAWMIVFARRWLLSPWPYLGAVLALAIFAPNLWWNATHHWMTFAFQFGRVGAGHFTLRYLFEFLGAQLLLASPFILVAALFTRNRLLIALMLPAILYFAVHSLHDRVQGNWPCFLYPMLAVAAAECRHWTAKPAVAVAAALLVLCYAQAFFAVAPLGRKDPISRLLAFGVPRRSPRSRRPMRARS